MVMSLLNIPSPRAFFPITWNSYSVPGVRLLIVTVVLPDGVTGIIFHSDVPDSLYLRKMEIYIYSQKVESVDALKDFLHKVSCATFITSFLPNIVLYITSKVKTENTICTYSSLVETSLVEETQRPIV